MCSSDLMTLLTVPKGGQGFIYRKNDPATCFYIVLAGRVEIMSRVGTVKATLKRLSSFGEFCAARFQAFWFWFFQRVEPAFLRDLDLKRLTQPLGAAACSKRRFLLSKTGEFEMELNLTPTQVLVRFKMPNSINDRDLKNLS